MEQILLIIHVISAVTLIGLILIQQGKGAEVGASFGSGASQTVFGSQGSGSFLTRLTGTLVTVFFITSLSLAYLATHKARPRSIDELIDKVQVESTAPESATEDSVTNRSTTESAAPAVQGTAKQQESVKKSGKKQGLASPSDSFPSMISPSTTNDGDIPKLKN